MKKIFFAFALISALVSCKKETTTPNNTGNNTSNSVNCIDNPKINFTSIGIPIGKFTNCIKDIDGNVYKTVTIGTQTWMAENLKVSKYNDGSLIPNITDSSKWVNLKTGAWSYYNNDATFNGKYGKLYNFFAVAPKYNGNRNVCPFGWHVPTDGEWDILNTYLGEGLHNGGKMKELDTTSWKSPNTKANNESLFTGLPGGSRGFLSGFEEMGIVGVWWSSLEDSIGFAWGHYLEYDSNDAGRYFSSYGASGFSVRCIKD
jgi:uncharacterized protein (TIGR02145 family)